jgi:hypothetical protein
MKEQYFKFAAKLLALGVIKTNTGVLQLRAFKCKFTDSLHSHIEFVQFILNVGPKILFSFSIF